MTIGLLEERIAELTDANRVLAQQLKAAEAELRLISAEQLKLYRRFHKPTHPSALCPHCHHRHLSKAHARRCPDCPCPERGS